MPVVTPTRQLRCERCGAEFTCGSGRPDTGARCWCQDLPKLEVRQAENDCLCPECLRREIGRPRTGQNSP
ncbi:cysteine-rich CWC family protein [Xanthobacter cornucopiae]|uniref:cysteine-rich CWC family protein n=1 Tax=Xanthobacter cornucopiae TaxID=3119924 RepID=UPI00372D6CA1